MIKKKGKIYSGQIPFDLKGNQLHYPEIFYFDFLEWNSFLKIGKDSDGKKINLNIEGVELTEDVYETPKKLYSFSESFYVARVRGEIWRENFVFEDTLVYKCYARGRSAAYFHFVRKSNGAQVTVFISNFSDMIEKMVEGKITGKFVFYKQGANFGCKLMEE